MKQGRANPDGRAGWKREPMVKEVSPGAVSQIGSAMGNHVTDQGQILRGVSRELYRGKGFEAPHDAACNVHRGGSQGRR